MNNNLSIDNPIFGGAKRAFDSELEITMRKMLGIGGRECKVTLTLESEIVGEDADGNVKPTFRYKIGSNIPIKGKAEGTMKDDYVLVPSDDGLQCIAVAEQTSML